MRSEKGRAEGSLGGKMAICAEGGRSAEDELLFCPWAEVVDCNRMGILRDVL